MTGTAHLTWLERDPMAGEELELPFLLPFLSPPHPSQTKICWVKNLGMCLSDTNLAFPPSGLQWQWQHWLALTALLVYTSLRSPIPKNSGDPRCSPPATPHQDSSRHSYSLKKRTQNYQKTGLEAGPRLTHNWRAVGSSAGISNARLHSIPLEKWCCLGSNFQGLIPWNGVKTNK